MHHNRLETYLDQVEQQLKRLPAWERQEWREEARQHLSALAEAREELGWTPEAALEASLQQFGEPERLGKELLASSSLALGARQESRDLAWSLHVLSWNAFITLAAFNTFLEHPATGPALVPTVAALALFFLGHTLGGVAFGWKVRNRSLGPVVNAIYLVLLTAAFLLTGLWRAWPAPLLLLANGSVLAALVLGAAASRWARLRQPEEQRAFVTPSG
jgi:hypothetical protein